MVLKEAGLTLTSNSGAIEVKNIPILACSAVFFGGEGLSKIKTTIFPSAAQEFRHQSNIFSFLELDFPVVADLLINMGIGASGLHSTILF